MSALGIALIEQLDDADLVALAEKLAPFLPANGPPARDGWMDSRATAAYLGISKDALHRLTSERRIPFSQDAPGARCYFQRHELDRWRGATP